MVAQRGGFIPFCFCSSWLILPTQPALSEGSCPHLHLDDFYSNKYLQSKVLLNYISRAQCQTSKDSTFVTAIMSNYEIDEWPKFNLQVRVTLLLLAESFQWAGSSIVKP